MKLILLGAPGAGKGTQADNIARALNIPAISTGNILRTAIKNETPVGIQAKAYMDKGSLAPDEVIIGIVDERLKADDCKNGYILDGVPRTIAQAEALESVGVEIDVALSLEVSDSVIEKRMTGRYACPSCGATYHVDSNPPKVQNVCDVCAAELVRRKDDEPETVLSRLKIYHEETEPLKDFYKSRGKLKIVEGQDGVEETSKLVFKTLGI